jgi:hypothetical protein
MSEVDRKERRTALVRFHEERMRERLVSLGALDNLADVEDTEEAITTFVRRFWERLAQERQQPLAEEMLVVELMRIRAERDI